MGQLEIKNPLKHHGNGPCNAVNQLTHTQVSLLILDLIYANFGPTPRILPASHPGAELLAWQLIRATRSGISDDQASNIMLMCTHSCINCFSIKVPSILLAVCLINVRIVYLREMGSGSGSGSGWDERREGLSRPEWVSAGWEKVDVRIRKNISCQSIWPPVTPDCHSPQNLPSQSRMHCLPKWLAFFFRISLLNFVHVFCVH